MQMVNSWGTIKQWNFRGSRSENSFIYGCHFEILKFYVESNFLKSFFTVCFVRNVTQHTWPLYCRRLHKVFPWFSVLYPCWRRSECISIMKVGKSDLPYGMWKSNINVIKWVKYLHSSWMWAFGVFSEMWCCIKRFLYRPIWMSEGRHKLFRSLFSLVFIISNCILKVNF